MAAHSFDSRYLRDASTGPVFPVQEGQEVLVVDNRGRTLWDLDKCLVSKGVVLSVKRTYVYVGTSLTDKFPTRYDKYTLIEARKDGYSSSRALFESEASFERERDYDETWEKILFYFKDGYRQCRGTPISYEKLKEIERLIDEKN